MAELILKQEERPGMAKEVDPGAWDLIFDAIQLDKYSFPIPSFIRETISNGLDSIVERDIAIKILNGTPQENYYLQRTDDKLLKDSSFDKDYYNTKYLSTDHRVSVVYTENTPRDTVTVTDHGVGLGGSRLRGFFHLGYSSKRNMKDVIGKFGSGSKAALSTGVDYFIMTTRYNGYATSFMILNRDYEAITPQHNSGKSEIWKVKMADGTIQDKTIYWEPTLEYNGVSVQVEVKKHNKKAYLAAVRNQFQYFGGRVNIRYPDVVGDIVMDHLKEVPLYESDNILIPKYSTYTVPHILVDGISYGIIDYPELELEKMHGKLAIKTKATEVDITQSRETLKYTERTKKVILAAVETAREEATDYITSLLDLADPKDLFKMNNIYGKLSKDGSTAVTSVFSKFLSMHNLKPKFDFQIPGMKWKGEHSIEVMQPVRARLNHDLFEFLFYAFKVRKISVVIDKGAITIDSDVVSNFETLRFKKIVYADTSTLGPKRANHLLEKYEVDSIIYIRPRSDRAKVELDGPIAGSYSTASVNRYVKALLLAYGDLNLDDYAVTYDETVKDVETGTVVSKELTLAQIRKLNKEVIYTVYRASLYRYGDIAVSRTRDRYTIKASKVEAEFEGEDLLIVPAKYAKLGHMVELTQLVFRSDRMTIIYISQENVRYFAPHGILITDYFRTVNLQTGELMIGAHIRNLNTLRAIAKLRDEYPEYSIKFTILSELTSLDVPALENMFNNSKETSPRKILETSYNIESALVDDIFGYLDTLNKFQKAVQTGDRELIAMKATEYFNSKEVYTVDAIDQELVDSVMSEFTRLKPIAPLLNLIYDTSIEDAKDLLNLLLTTKQKEHESKLEL